MTAFLLSIAIGPVQDFIAAARKTRDLFYGSWLLSQMSKACARHLYEQGATLIFPNSDNLSHDLAASNQDFAVVNKILALVKTEHESTIQTLASRCGETVQNWLLHEYRHMERNVRHLIAEDWNYDDVLAVQQIGNAFELYSAWAPVHKDGYTAAREHVEQIIAARKVLRNFAPHRGSYRPKSSLDGFRETVIEYKAAAIPKRSFIRPNELLDGVGLLKRMGRTKDPDRIRFDSTHDIAAASFVEKANRQAPEAHTAYRNYMQKRRAEGKGPFSYSPIYHEERDDPEELRALVKPLRKLNPATPYYGLFIGDGDSMGKTIGTLDEAGHKDFSRHLSSFAQKAHTVLEQDSEPIFTGGDDVMAFLPLHLALDKAAAVRQAFEGSMHGLNVTFSAGLVVCHAMDSLTEAVKWTHTAEQDAKSVRDKDALCVRVVPRSGESVTVKGKWKLARDLAVIAKLYVGRKLTLSLAHEFQALLDQWKNATEKTRDKLDLQLPDLAAAVARKKQTSVEALRLVDEFCRSGEPRAKLEYLTNCLYVARPFARAMREATGE